MSSTRRAATDRLAYRIWVEAAPAVRLARGLGRDGPDHLDVWQNWLTMEDEFFAADATRGRADLYIDTSLGPAAG